MRPTSGGESSKTGQIYYMDPKFVDQFRHSLNNEVARRLLIRYFLNKGYECFDQLIYPPLIQDLPYAIQEMVDKVEVIPHAKNIDPLSDSATLGWNLFVLGHQRIYLGETYHNGLKQLALQLQRGAVIAESQMATHQTTPKRIVAFIIRILESHEGGFVNLTPRVMPLNMRRPQIGGANMAHTFFTRSGYGT